jgi:hypothetical protein
MAKANASIARRDEISSKTERFENRVDLESDLHDAVNMAFIAADLLENAFGDKNNHREITGKPNTYHLGDEQLEAMLFAVYETHDKIDALRNKYLTALERD